MNAVENEVPAIWRSPIFIGSKHIQPLDARRADGSWHTKAISDAQRLFKAIPKGEEPAFLTLRKGLRLPSPQSADAMTIGGGYVVISQKLRDVLVQFDLGATRLFELPVYNGFRSHALGPATALHVACVRNQRRVLARSVGRGRADAQRVNRPAPAERTVGFSRSEWRRGSCRCRRHRERRRSLGLRQFAGPYFSQRPAEASRSTQRTSRRKN